MRIAHLKALAEAIRANEDKITAALFADLGKSACESYMCEVGMVLSEIRHMVSHVSAYAKVKKVKTPMSQFPSKSYIIPEPYGVALVMSPWNYPFLLTLDPVVSAVAAGNTVCVKPSAYSPNTSRVIKELISGVFDSGYVSVVEGGREENKALLDEHFDYIFFTGSCAVGKEVMRKASDNLTPVTLELGGKSPCIVDETAKIPLAARRLVFGKYLNAGQTCVAPDHVYVHSSIADKFVEAVKAETAKQYPNIDSVGKIINEKHYNRLLSLIDENKVILGGKGDAAKNKIEPTVMTGVTESDAVMKEEIFGPIMPIMTYDNLDELLRKEQRKPSPLALYIFSENRANIKRIQTVLRYGGGCVNDTIVHLATSEMPFGGIGNSGMGAYHGEEGFRTFTHYKSILDKSTLIDMKIRYSPYTKKNENMIRRFVK